MRENHMDEDQYLQERYGEDDTEAELKKENALLNDKVRDGIEIIKDLKEQIEKMKCCQNCKYMNCLGQCKKGINAECNNWKMTERS